MDITITDMWDAKRRLDEFPYVISIMDPYGPFPQKAENHFIARFEDSEYDVSGPCIWDIRGILDNARDWGLTKDSKILIHCMAGISRSTAIAWAILVLVGYTVQEAKDILLQVRPEAWPNLLVLRYADKLLELNGELLQAGKELDQEVQARALGGQSG
jgi:predicted protein tyrosine phosphatase